MPIYGLTRRNHMDDFIADFFSKATETVTRYPLTNIGYDDNHVLYIELAVAGFSKEDISIDLTGDILTITGVKSDSEELVDINWKEKNISSKDFERKIRLGDSYLGSEINASMEDGILSIIIPSTTPDKTVITIK